nr:MAG TPA: hypothetical protein [Caudoviricetes sp.]
MLNIRGCKKLKNLPPLHHKKLTPYLPKKERPLPK